MPFQISIQYHKTKLFDRYFNPFMKELKNDASKKKCCDCSFFKLFILQFFDIGKSTGSLIGEAINIFRIFQRSTASKSFSLLFSMDYLKILRWATNLIQIITVDLFTIKKLSEFELYIMYGCIIPLTLLFFISGLVIGPWLIVYLILYLAFLLFGIGFGFIGISKSGAIGCSVAGAILIIGAIYFMTQSTVCCQMGCFRESNDERIENMTYRFKNGGFQLSFAMIPTVFIFTFHVILAFFNNLKFALICVFAAYLVLIIFFLFELFTKNCCCCGKKTTPEYEKYNIKMITFVINLFSLIIIPATENFVSLIKNDNKQWRLIIGYITLAVLLPLIMNFMLIKCNFPDICDKYKTPNGCVFNWYPYIELLNFIKQIVFAIVSSYDINYACIIIEIAWSAFIIALRPINGISSYSLIVGESIVMIITNSAALYQKSHIDYTFSFAATIVFVVLCCIPAVVSLYLFFIFDFDTKINSNDDDKFDSESIGKTISITIWLIPFGFVFVGMHYPLFIENFD